MKLLHIISSIDSRAGGIAEGVLRLQASLSALGHENEVLSLDEPGDALVQSFPCRVHALGPASLGNYAYCPRLVPWLRKNAQKYDAVIVNGLWQHIGLATFRAVSGRTPYFVFSHGMLDPWFKQHYPLKHLKKWLYWPWGEYRVLRGANAVLFTCEEERRLARRSFWLYRCNEAVVSYGTAEPPQDSERLSDVFFQHYPELRAKRIVLFLGRIHEKKGCDLLIDAFATTSAQMQGTHLVMAGPDQEGLSATLQARAVALGVEKAITWTGMLSRDLKWGAFHASEVFCLPSHQENFGVAVAEALACGLPALISDKVNIWNELSEDGAGFVETDSLAGTKRLLQRWLASTPPEMAAMKIAARRCFDQRFRMERVAQNVVRVIRQSTGPATTPSGAATQDLGV